ncbi:hypothetical protein PMIN04_002319 [Paraphaeosphaeria minitans]
MLASRGCPPAAADEEVGLSVHGGCRRQESKDMLRNAPQPSAGLVSFVEPAAPVCPWVFRIGGPEADPALICQNAIMARLLRPVCGTSLSKPLTAVSPDENTDYLRTREPESGLSRGGSVQASEKVLLAGGPGSCARLERLESLS